MFDFFYYYGYGYFSYLIFMLPASVISRFMGPDIRKKHLS